MTEALAVLLLATGSCWSDFTVAVLVNVLPAATVASTDTWMSKLVELPDAILPRLQVTVPATAVQVSVLLT